MFRRIFERNWNLILQALQHGTTPRMLALTCSLGVLIGIFPVYGSTTMLCFAAAFAFRLNVLLIQAVNYLVTPLQLLLLLPLMQAGNRIFGWPPLPFSMDELTVSLQADFWAFTQGIARSVAAGVAVWCVASVLAMPLLFLGFFRIFHAIKNRRTAS